MTKVERIMYRITAMMSRLLHGATDEVRSAMGEAVDEFIDQINGWVQQGADQTAIARGTQASLDGMMEDAKQRNPEWPNVTCAKGCHHCCKMTVAITSHEAMQLVQVAREKGILLDPARMVRQLPYGDESWKTQPEEDRACPFLSSDGLCQVYEDRPLSCRKYYVVSPPELCNIDKFPGGQTLVFCDAAAEMLTTAAFTQGGCGFMPAMLLEALAKEDAHVKK